MSGGRAALFALEIPRERRSFFPFCREETSTNIYQLKLGSASCVQLETPLMIIHHSWSLLGRESWSRWIPQGKTRMLFVSDSIIHSLTGLSWISPSRNAILAVGTCAASRLAAREELDKSPCRRCVWNHFGIAAFQRPNAAPHAPAAASGALPSFGSCSRKGKVPVCPPGIQPPCSGLKAQILETQEGTNFSHR